MVEIKSVKVDNWGVFFLQKLQNFFNKTDYCDLTLQFQDNSQLKVHRLVLSACTDFFNILEQQCEVNDDILIMPRDLQADVVVPIVNFMYTGTLEFEVNMYGRLLKTARDMSMTVLLKLLEAHKRTVDVPKDVKPVLLNKAPITSSTNRQVYAKQTYAQGVVPQRTYTPRKQTTSQQKQKNTPDKMMSQPSVSYIRKTLPEPVQLVARYANTPAATQKGPSRFDCADDSSLPEHFENSFDNISYESKPLITASQIKEEKDLDYDEPSTSSSFEQLRKGYTGPTKRPLSSPSYGISPPEKKPNLKDIMEYTEAERIRKEIVAAEEFEGTEYVDENFSNDDDSGGNTEQFKQSTSVVVKEEPSNVNHAKIIHEVLKKYPHLVKNNKNIKLKILQKGNQTAAAAVPTTTAAPIPVKFTAATAQFSPPMAPASKQQITTVTASTRPNILKKTPPTATVATPAPPTGQAPKKIDSKTMHALIAKGAENMTGPWLCLRCGVNGRPISIPSYKSFRRHLVNVHRERIDSRICEHCGLKSQRKDESHHHMLIKHNIKPPADVHFPKCNQCQFLAPHNAALNKHRDEKHAKPKLNAHHCIYCNKTFSNEILVYAHMRNNHKERACEDGVMDFDEDEGMDDMDQYIPNNNEILGIGNTIIGTSSGGGILVGSSSQSTIGGSGGDNKIKIISNIALPTKGIPYVIDPSAHTVSSIGGTQLSQQQQQQLSQQANINLEPSSEAEGLSTVASGIATSLGVLDNSGNDDDQHDEDFHDSAADTRNTQQGTGGNDIISNQYIETELANVHGEYNLKKEEMDENLPQFVTEEGSQLDLTPTQKADLLQQLQDQQNVVMILNEGETYDDQTQQILTGDNQNIVLVYSQPSDITKESSILQAASSIVSDSEEKATVETTTTTTSTNNNNKAIASTSAVNKDAITKKSMEKDSSELQSEDDDMDIEPPATKPLTVKIETKETDQKSSSPSAAIESSTSTATAKTEKKQEKSSLISTLEGDWSEDENMETDEIKTEPEEKDVPKKEEAIVAPLPPQPKAQYSNRRAKAADDDKEKKSDETTSSSSSVVKDDIEKSTKKSESNIGKGDGKDEKNGNDDDITETKKNIIDETKIKESDPLDSKISKNEIKTLINDWGDDDDDDDDDEDDEVDDD